MLQGFIYFLVFSGAALMVYNIYGFIRFAGNVKKQKSWTRNNRILYIPIAFLVMFLLGYVIVGALGKPDLVMAGILFGGSIFVFIMYLMLNGIVRHIIEGEKLQAKLLAAEESNRTKNNFLASISHEMRTPMNVIIGLDTLALSEPALPAQTRSHLEKIGMSANHLLELINNILDLNRIDSGEYQVKNDPFVLADAMQQVNSIMQTLCERKGLNFHVSGCEHVGCVCLGDELMLKKVLLCLLDNAVKFTDAPGDVFASVDCRPGEDGKEIFTFSIKDTGIGMDEEFMASAFEVFSQADASSTSRHGGSGLGLALTKQLLDLMGGTIRVESEKGVGSCFTVTLPMEIKEKLQQAQSREEALQSLEGCRVLIVEDMPENAEIAADLLELEGVSAEHAENGQIGLDMFAQSPPHYYDAIMMDLRMPVMDGLESTRRIRALDREDANTVPIIALTANAFESDIRDTLHVGMNAHLAKPADADLLYDTLKKQIGASRSAGGSETT